MDKQQIRKEKLEHFLSLNIRWYARLRELNQYQENSLTLVAKKEFEFTKNRIKFMLEKYGFKISTERVRETFKEYLENKLKEEIAHMYSSSDCYNCVNMDYEDEEELGGCILHPGKDYELHFNLSDGIPVHCEDYEMRDNPNFDYDWYIQCHRDRIKKLNEFLKETETDYFLDNFLKPYQHL